MPTYRNDNTKTLTVRDLNWDNTQVASGETVESYVFLDIAGLTKTADTPLFNRATGNTSVTLAETAVTHTLNPHTTSLIITDITGAVTATVTDGEPGLIPTAATSDTPVVVIERPKITFEYIRLSGSGTCTVQEFRDWPWELN